MPTPRPAAAAAGLLPPLLLLLAAGCAGLAPYGAALVERRRAMNDAQARATMAATCDIALGAYFRELSDAERRYAGLACGGAFPPPPPPPPPPAPAAAWPDDGRPRLLPLPPPPAATP